MKDTRQDKRLTNKPRFSEELNYQEICKAYKEEEMWTISNKFNAKDESDEESQWFKGSRSRGTFNKQRNNIAA